jgi:hypothetical protein
VLWSIRRVGAWAAGQSPGRTDHRGQAQCYSSSSLDVGGWHGGDFSRGKKTPTGKACAEYTAAVLLLTTLPTTRRQQRVRRSGIGNPSGGFLPGEKKILRFGRSASWPKSPPILVTLYSYLLVNKALFDPQKKKGRGTRGGVVRYQQPAQSTHGSSKA